LLAKKASFIQTFSSVKAQNPFPPTIFYGAMLSLMEKSLNKRFKLTSEYDGRPFSGWQRQENAPSVQEKIESALQQFLGTPHTIFVAGRTDAGVHAKGQVAHVDLPHKFSEENVKRALNFYLKEHPISILSAEAIPETFHARFSAKQRHYLYRLINRGSPITFERGLVWWVPVPLDIKAMEEAAQHLLGTHDFSTFRTVRCQAHSPIRSLDHIGIDSHGEEIRFSFSAQSFLHHQVRNFVGSLCLVGKGHWTPQDLKRALEARDRRRGGPTAPPDGLYFMKVDYDT
jgi:tRNA pseudouridine38-40 synthase